MRNLHAFLLGLGGQRVDYSTRHHSRAYDLGWGISCACFISLPFVACFVAGLGVGAIIWR